MANVVPMRPTIFEAAHNISVAFAQADKARNKAHSMRVEIGLDLIDLKRRVDAGEARKAGEPQEFWVWIKLRVGRSLQDMRKCIALAKAEDPEAAAAQERADTRERVRKHREKQEEEQPRAYSTRPAEVVKFDPVERALDQIRGVLAALSEDERRQVITQLKEDYPW